MLEADPGTAQAIPRDEVSHSPDSLELNLKMICSIKSNQMLQKPMEL